ncbi:MAG TPA: nucleoside-triphosphatase [Bacteroidales bacterium]|nr:nucleoside-triphosphatase [Bacteroidales bacterium]
MNYQNNPSNSWLKAAVLGSLWAASEIVLGSFLHNLKIPFRSNILTAIGIILLISAAQHWHEKGLFWRSGLVCAMMKSISPSAIIFGPMIAIFMEALLMETAVRIFKRNTVGFLIAGALAMSWNFVQFLVNKFIFYGYQFYDLYQNSVQFIEHQYNIIVLNLTQLIVAVLSIYFLSGLVVAWMGLKIGKKSMKQRIPIKSITVNEVKSIKQNSIQNRFRYSLFWLFFDLALVVAVFLIFSWVNFKISLMVGICIFILFLIRYHHRMKKIINPLFILSLLVLMFFSIAVVYINKPSPHSLLLGLQNGMEMSIRAMVLVAGFTAIGTELKNPIIIQWAYRSVFRQAAQAVEIAISTLPTIISACPPVKTFIKKPTLAVYEMISYLDYWLEESELKAIGKKNILIISGKEKSGKSTLLRSIVTQLKKEGLSIGGFVSPAVIENNQHVGYNLIHLQSQQEIPLSRTELIPLAPKVGNYYFFNQSIEEGNRWLQLENLKHVDMIVIDEIGPWELRQQGWSKSLTNIVKNDSRPILLVVRESIVEKVIRHWGFRDVSVIYADEQNAMQKAIQTVKTYMQSS